MTRPRILVSIDEAGGPVTLPAEQLLSRVLLVCLVCRAAPTAAQPATSRDSAGIAIVVSATPLLAGARALALDSAPSLIIGTRVGAPYELARVRGAARLANGSIVVADGASTELRLFDAMGTFVKVLGRKGGGPGEFPTIESLMHFGGDTVAVIAGQSRGLAVYYTAAGAFLWNVNLYASPPVRAGGVNAGGVDAGGRKMIVGAFGDGSTVVVQVDNPAPRARGERWLQSTPVAFVDRSGTVTRSLGDQPLSTFAMEEYPRPPWFAAPIATASTDQSFYIGLGTEYSIRQYARDGRLVRIVRRSWTPRRVTRDDIDRYVVEWGKRWIKSTGVEAEKARTDLRDDPYDSVVPAFSQIIVDRASRLWVRTPDLRDAPRVGQLNSTPLVPSSWSVFDRNGRWLCDVTLPANFQPLEIGDDYMLAALRDADQVETVALYRLRSGR